MKAKAFKAFFKLIRLDYSLLCASGVFLSGLLAGDLHGLQPEYLVAFLIVFLSAVSSFAFNDYYDFEVDKRNDRYDRPLVTGLVPRELALVTGLVSFSLVAFLSLFLGLIAMALVLVTLPLFFLYSFGLKKIFFFKNLLIAYAYVATILFGAVVSDTILEPLIIYFAVMGLIVGLAFEIMLDISDVKGDKALGIKTLATKHGVELAAKFSVVLYGAIIILDPLPFFVLIDSRLYLDYVFLSLISVPIVSYFFISRSLIEDQSKGSISNLKKKILLTMLAGCIAYLAGVLL